MKEIDIEAEMNHIFNSSYAKKLIGNFGLINNYQTIIELY
jgi:hypothetical protein